MRQWGRIGLIPIDLKLCLGESVAGAGLPTGIGGDGTDNGDTMPLLAIDQNV